jgi:hypothetical protein
VPRRSGQSAKGRSLADWCIEFVVYGFGGGLMGFLFGLLILTWA